MKRSVLALGCIMVLAVAIFLVWSVQDTKEISRCGFGVTNGELTITIRNGTVATVGTTRIGANVGPDDSFILTFFNGGNEKKYNVKECATLEYRAGADTLTVKVSSIRPDTSWWGITPGSNNASVELIVLRAAR